LLKDQYISTAPLRRARYSLGVTPVLALKYVLKEDLELKAGFFFDPPERRAGEAACPSLAAEPA